MKILMLLFAIAAVFSSTTSWGQLAAPNDAGVSMGHVHLHTADVDAAKKFWTDVGGTPVEKLGANEVVRFPGVLVLLVKGDVSGPSVGSVVNHVGFLVPDVPTCVAKWKQAGIKIEPGRNEQQVFLYSPGDEVRVEILQDPNQKLPIVFHHVHYFVATSGQGGAEAIPEIQAWYAKMFGAKPGKRASFDADDLPGVNLTFSKSDTATAPTKGRALDHIGFESSDLEALCQKLAAAGVKFDRPFTKRPDLGVALAFITDPWGTQIELTQGLTKW